jgi:DNA polymerase III subunit alpha
METASVMHRDRTRGQMSFFDVGSAGSEAAFMMTVDDRPKQVREWHENERLAYEKELLGFYITGHPLAWYAPILERFSTTTVRKLPEHEADAVVTVGGMLTRIRHTTTKRTNERMAVGVLEDLSGDAEILIFPATYPQVHQHLTPNALIFVEGRINLRDEQPKIIVQKITPAQEAERQMTHALEIEVQTPGLDDAVLEELKDILTTAPGAIPVYLTMGAMKRDRVKIALGSEWKIDPRPELIIALEELVGKGQVALKR